MMESFRKKGGEVSASYDLSQNIRNIRSQKGLERSEIASQMGLNPDTLDLWESGKTKVPASKVRALAEALDVSVEELFYPGR